MPYFKSYFKNEGDCVGSNRPLIKLFKTVGKYYVYDTNRNIILNISSKQYKILENCIEDDNQGYAEIEEIDKLRKEGFLSSNRVKEIVHPYDELASFYLENNIKMLILQVTQQCNFRCEYCVYSGNYLTRTHSSKKMSISTAFKGIDFIINHSKNNNKINIGFYGGEPLLEFDFVKKCIEYAEEKAEGKDVEFNMTTNGSLLNDEIVEFLYKHNVSLTISLDGPKEIQDSHRKFAFTNCGSFDKVMKNIENIEKKFPMYVDRILFNAVLDPQNDFSCIDKFFLNYKGVKDIFMTSGLISNNSRKSEIEMSEDYYIKREYELFRIFYCLLKKKDTKKCSRIVMEEYGNLSKFAKELTPQSKISEKNHPSGACVPGVQRLFMNTDGFFYPCERVSETSELMRIGHVNTGFDMDKVKKLLNIGRVNENVCKNCWAIRLCSICASMMDSGEEEFSAKRKEECCKKVKKSIEETFKDYCVLREFGHNFDEDEKMVLFDN